MPAEGMFIVSLLELSEVTGRMCDFRCPLRNTSQLSRRAARVQVDDKSDYRTFQAPLYLSGFGVNQDLAVEAAVPLAGSQ
jgi:hypothetical protein